jgi:myo-inositol-1(or 4)-monophosphatase
MTIIRTGLPGASRCRTPSLDRSPMSQALHPMLNTAIKAARAAGAIINRASLDLDLLKVNTKSPNDFVTEVDHKAEAIIIETLLGAYPGHGILAEESGRAHGARDSEYVWIIDPLDGTTNFIHGFPVYSVSIALAFRGQVQQAVVYDPTRNDLFYASKGRGAFLNDKRLRVSKRVRLADCLIGTGFPFRKGDNFKRYMQIFEIMMQSCAGLRRPGSAAIDLCYLAAGYTDGFFETGLSPWDIAAGSLIVTEAGGLIGNFTGESDYLYQRELVAGTPRVYGQMVALLSPFSRVIASDAVVGSDAAGGEAGSVVTPESALAAGLASEPGAAAGDPAPAPAKRAATRISKESMAREKQASVDADRKPPRARTPRGGDAPF